MVNSCYDLTPLEAIAGTIDNCLIRCNRSWNATVFGTVIFDPLQINTLAVLNFPTGWLESVNCPSLVAV